MSKVTDKELDVKVDELEDFLLEKNMSQEGYVKVTNIQKKFRNYDILSYCEEIYGLFEFIGLNEEQIEAFIVKNPNIFIGNKDVIRKIAYVLKEVNANDEFFGSSNFVGRITNYKRLFMRDLVCKRGGKYDRGNGVSILVVHDKEAYSRYHLSIAAYNVFKKDINSDEELEYELNRSLLSNQEHITVEEFIDKYSKLLYLKYFNKKYFDGKKAEENSMSEGGKGSI